MLPGYEDRLDSQNSFINMAKMPNFPHKKSLPLPLLEK